MLFIFFSFLSFLLLSHSFLNPHPTPKPHLRMYIFHDSLRRFLLLLCRKRKNLTRVFHFPPFLSSRLDLEPSVTKEERERENFLLDLPDLPLDLILQKLPPSDLCSLSGVSSWLRMKCTSDHLWEKHMIGKWGGVIGDGAWREWRWRIASEGAGKKVLHCEARSRFRVLSGFFDLFGRKSAKESGLRRSSLPVDSVMACYLAVEAGKFWFPAQVFNREVQNGHVGFVLSCYDAHLSYGSTTDNFVARYRAQGRSIIEEGIGWDRIRAPTIDTPANVVHVSECLNELKPGDHIEIQWRRNKEFPYGWWYGVVGHLDSCSANQFNCQCHINDTVILEFKQYSPGSRWRKTMISRKDHREVGNERNGFYGGVRKIYKEEEIARWKKLWPNCTLE